MTGAEHYAEAERIAAEVVKEAKRPLKGRGGQEAFEISAAWMVPLAQVHATLALAAASETRQGFVLTDADVMRCEHGAAICGLCGYGVQQGGRS